MTARLRRLASGGELGGRLELRTELSLAELEADAEGRELGELNVAIAACAAELERAVRAVHVTDRALRDALAKGAVALGLSPEATVREVAGAAPEPWGYIFGQHREDLQRSIDRVAQLSRTNRQLLARGHAATVSAMQFLGADVPSGYDAAGNAAPVSGSVGLLDTRA